MKCLVTLCALASLLLTAGSASAQCGVRSRGYAATRAVEYSRAVEYNRHEIVTPVSFAIPVVTVVAAYGAAYVPPAHAAAAALSGYGASGLGTRQQTTCEQNVALLLARIEALEKGQVNPPSAATGAQQPLPTGPPAATQPSAATPTPAAPGQPPSIPTVPGETVKAIPNVPTLVNRSCVQCHAGAAAKAKLDFSTGKPLSCEQRLEVIRRINLTPTDKDVMPPAKANHTPVTDQEAAEMLEWLTKKK